ncbi:amino acid ABC transporter substrate-binding protein [Pseudoalteromonas sp. MMG022]|uniref:amino acid ABC transporter substrate-binding protein n=1 Tax=Pseudoalteromonas sp. MMG022 TaxID=2909978 RepID=UPI001F40D388|nr:amino acid ABC transporter substrate-binding protein [Pseudoalteromonas sp. MMG022]MCF6434266.1 amino acid ABC transporter substrate-binding protein [Pseudoalteromonas sp. MMG022]
MLVRWIIYCYLLLHMQALFAQTLTFCYEDKELAPSYMGKGLEVPPINPGASIEALQAVEENIRGLTIIFVRQPWQRCLHDIKRNKVDAVIASYVESRQEFMIFPSSESGQLDITLALNKLGRCLVGSKEFVSQLDANEGTFNIAIPRGYSSADRIADPRFTKVDTLSQKDAFDLVSKEVVDGTFGLCMINGEQVSAYPYAGVLHAKYPPFDMSYGFLAFSKNFYENNKELAKQVWGELASFPFAEVYMRYLEENDKKVPQESDPQSAASSQ